MVTKPNFLKVIELLLVNILNEKYYLLKLFPNTRKA